MRPHFQSIHFHYLGPTFYFPNRGFTKTFLASIFADHDKKITAVNYIFCSDQYLLNLNITHLNHNFYTDILTFDLGNDPGITADIFISVERAKENALLFKVTMITEIMRLLVHGALHLCGFKDETQEDAYKMKEKENKYLRQYLVSRET